MRSTTRLRTCGWMLVLLMAATGVCFGQGSVSANQMERDLASLPLENVQIEAQSIGSLLTSLSLDYDVPIGVEIALNDDYSAPYTFDFKRGTLAELLTQLVAQYDQYRWEIRDGVVNVFPREKYRDFIMERMLQANIEDLSIKEGTSCWALEDVLANSAGVKDVGDVYGLVRAGLNFSGFYFPQLGRHFTLDISNMTLQAALNTVVKKSPLAKVWVIKKYSNERTFYIRLSARHEDSPIINQDPRLRNRTLLIDKN